MICISIANKSRRFALVDLFNAAPQCDLVEVRLDYFDQAANISELLAHKQKPVIMTCRRAEDGGEWMGQEEQRLALLRQCIVSKADYVEIELDVADKIPALPPSKRVISYINLVEIPDDLPRIYQQALTKNPDIVKLTVPARTPEEVWPVVQILAKPAVPTVVVGVGKPGIMLALLGARWEPLGSTRPSNREWKPITSSPPFATWRRSTTTTRSTEPRPLRRSPALASCNSRTWPCSIPSLPTWASGSAVCPWRSVIASFSAKCWTSSRPEVRSSIRPISPLSGRWWRSSKPSATQAQAVDLMTHADGKWVGSYLFGSAVFFALHETLPAGKSAEKPLAGRVFLLVGVNHGTRILAVKTQQAGGVPLLTSSTISAAEELAKTLGCRSIPEEARSTTPYDVLVRCDETVVPPEVLKPGTVVMDLTTLPRPSPLLAEAEQRGCRVVGVQQILLQLVSCQVRNIVRQEVPREVLLEALCSLQEN